MQELRTLAMTMLLDLAGKTRFPLFRYWMLKAALRYGFPVDESDSPGEQLPDAVGFATLLTEEEEEEFEPEEF